MYAMSTATYTSITDIVHSSIIIIMTAYIATARVTNTDSIQLFGDYQCHKNETIID